MMKYLVIAVALITAISTEARVGTIFFFDDFESEPVPPDQPGYIGNYVGFQNWDVIGSGVDLIGPGPNWPARVDSLMVDLDGNSGSTLVTKQTFAIVPGTYTLSFALGGPVGGAQFDTVQVQLGTVLSDSLTIQRGDPFVNFTRTVVVSNATTGKLSFTDLGADSNGGLLDNVKLDFTPVPDPSTIVIWSLVSGMFGVVWSYKRLSAGHFPAIYRRAVSWVSWA